MERTLYPRDRSKRREVLRLGGPSWHEASPWADYHHRCRQFLVWRPLRVKPHAVISWDADLAANHTTIDIDNVSAEIERLTNELAGDGSVVSAKPIYLKILRPSGPTLTLIDLPGITHNSADATQQDIHTETVNLVEMIISEENMVNVQWSLDTSSICVLLELPLFIIAVSCGTSGASAWLVRKNGCKNSEGPALVVG